MLFQYSGEKMELARKYLLLVGLAGGLLLTVTWLLFFVYEVGRLFL
jgi:hypothetical protein